MWCGGFLGTALFVCSSWFSRLEFGFGLDCGFSCGVGLGCWYNAPFWAGFVIRVGCWFVLMGCLTNCLVCLAFRVVAGVLD